MKCDFWTSVYTNTPLQFRILTFFSQLATLPDRLHYSTVRIESPTGKILHLPRRELYDIRVQLMAEDEAGNDETLNDIDKSDIRTGVYEGGFKTWECSLDLASLLLDRGPRKDIDELVRCDQVVEVCIVSWVEVDDECANGVGSLDVGLRSPLWCCSSMLCGMRFP